MARGGFEGRGGVRKGRELSPAEEELQDVSQTGREVSSEELAAALRAGIDEGYDSVTETASLPQSENVIVGGPELTPKGRIEETVQEAPRKAPRAAQGGAGKGGGRSGGGDTSGPDDEKPKRVPKRKNGGSFEGNLRNKLTELNAEFNTGVINETFSDAALGRALPQERHSHAKRSDQQLLDQGENITYIGSKKGAKNAEFYAKRKKAFGQVGKAPTPEAPGIAPESASAASGIPAEAVEAMKREDALNDPAPVTPKEAAEKLNAVVKLAELRAKYGVQRSESPFGQHSYSIDARNPLTSGSAAEASPTSVVPSVEYDPAKHSFEEAARIYQAGDYTESVPAARAAEAVVPVVAETATPAKEAETIFGKNVILARQMGLKGVKPVFSDEPWAGLPPKSTRVEKTKPVRAPKEKKRNTFLKAIGLGAILSLIAPGEHYKEHVPSRPTASRSIEAHIEKHGEGADKVFVRLQQKLQTAYPDAKHRSGLVNELLSYKNPDDFSKKYGFETLKEKKILSLVAREHKPDTLIVSPDGNRLVYVDAKGVAHTLKQVIPGAGTMTYPQENLEMRPYGQQSYAVHTDRVRQSVEKAPTAAPGTAPAETASQLPKSVPMPEKATPGMPGVHSLDELTRGQAPG